MGYLSSALAPPRTDDPLILEVFDLWNRKRGDRRAPDRAEFDPLEMPRLLRYLFLYDTVPGDPLDFRFRLVGTAIVDALQTDPTGKPFDTVYRGKWRGRITAETRAVAETFRYSHVADRDADWIGRKVMRYERILLPLNDLGSHAGMILGLAIFRDPGGER